jgi:hypothetical protein
VILGLLLACSARVPLGDAMVADVPPPGDYAALAREATRELRLYDGLATSLLARVAYLDANFRRAMEGMRAHLLLLEAPAREARLSASLDEGARAHVFVIAADGQDREALRFGAGEDVPWRLRAFVAGRPCAPEAVEELEPSPIDARLYPFHTRWSALWSARFAADCGASGPVILQVTGPAGAGELGWRTATAG